MTASSASAASAAVQQAEPRPTDQQVISVVRNGDVDAFAVLVDRYYGPLARHLTYRSCDPEVGADFTQETFLEAFRHLEQFDGEGPFAAWLYGIAHNRLRMYWRRQRLRRLISLEWVTGSVTNVPPTLQHIDGSEGWDEQDLLTQVFVRLSPPLRDALLLHSLDGFTAPEIAHILDISCAAAERRISRAKEQFRQWYWELSEDRGEKLP
jgi:RNA polymerase sigma-70 factor, ECF subfamily